MLLQRIQQQFIDSADLKYQCAELLAAPVEAAVSAVLATVTSGGKVLACGQGVGALLAQQLVGHFVGQLERERPGLAAVYLTPSTPVALFGGGADALARQVQALGQAEDLLLVLDAEGNTPDLHQAVAAAHERDLTVVALTGAGGGALKRLLRDTDVLVSVPHERLARIHETHQLVLHCIADGVDVHLMGDDSEQPENDT